MAHFERRHTEHQKSDGKDNAPRESEHRNAPIGHAARPFDEDGHNTFAIVGPAANNQDGRDLDNVDDHKPPERTHDVIQMIDDGNTQLSCQWQTQEESQQTRTEGDGRLPRLEATRTEGHDAVDDAMPNGQLLSDAERHQRKVEQDGPKR